MKKITLTLEEIETRSTVFALGHFVSNLDDFESIDEVIENFIELVKAGDLIVWQPFENELPEEVFANFEDMRDGLISVFSHQNESTNPSPPEKPFKVFAVWGEQDSRRACNIDDVEGGWSELENDPTVYEFETEAEMTAFIQGCEAAEGWLDWYSLSEEEYEACCQQREI